MRGACDVRHERASVRLCKGLSVAFDSTSVPHGTGKATVRLVDYPSHGQMPSNDYLATSKVQCQGTPHPHPSTAVRSEQRPHQMTFDLMNPC